MKLRQYGNRPIIVSRDPELPMEVTPKSYVDNLIYLHENNTDIHVTASQKEILDAMSVGATELNHLTGLTGNVQAQIDGKVAKDGDTMTGFLKLHAVPTENLHAATKSYVDTEAGKRVAKDGDTMTGFLKLHADPTENLHAATKQYTDSSIVTHANDTSIHLKSDDRTLLDGITVTSSEINQLEGITGNVQDQLDTKFDKEGGTVTGDITLANGKTVFVSKVPVADSELVNKAYVDSLVDGKEWKDPISSPFLMTVGVPNIVYASGKFDGVTVISPETTGNFVKGHAYVWVDYDQQWVDLYGRPVAVDDRFGVNLSDQAKTGYISNTYTGKLVTIHAVGEEEGVPTYEFKVDTLTPGSSTLVFDQDSPQAGQTWSLMDEGNWSVTGSSISFGIGSGLEVEGNTLNVIVGDGLEIGTNNEVKAKVTDASHLKVTSNGIDLPYKNQHFQKGSNDELMLAEQLTNDIDDKLSKSVGGDIKGSVSFDSIAELNLNYTPTAGNHAVTKDYVDNSTGPLEGRVETLEGKVETLELDPVTKGYVDVELAKKVAKDGDSMTGFLTLHSAPTDNLHAATKQYVDVSVSTHEDKTDIHVTAAQKAILNGLTVDQDDLNALAGIDSNVQDQLDVKVNLAGDTMLGKLTLDGAPVDPLHAVTKAYVDDADDLKLDLAGGTMTGPLILARDPQSDSEAATMSYVDWSISELSTDVVNELDMKVDKAGDSMTGFLTLHAAPTDNLHAATKGYTDTAESNAKDYADGLDGAMDTRVATVEGKVATLELDPVTKTYVNEEVGLKVNKAGDTMTGPLVLSGKPTEDNHAANKKYVDDIAQGLRAKPAVRLATTGNLAGTYDNGTQGVGATFTLATNGLLTVDGKEVEVGDRILLIKQTSKLQNGDYVVQQTGDASTPAILKRATTIDESHEVPSSYFYVAGGDTMRGTGWTAEVANTRKFVIGTDDILFHQFSGQGTVIAGDGLTMDGNTISVGTAGTDRIVVNGDNIDLAMTGVNPGTYTKVIVDKYGRVIDTISATTLADYGITDAQPLDPNLTSMSAISTNGVIVRKKNGDVLTRVVKAKGDGVKINDGNGDAGDIEVELSSASIATPSTLVYRDASGDFSANEITASLVGNASTATKLKDSRDFEIESDDIVATPVSFNGTDDVKLVAELTETGVDEGIYNLVEVDEKGRVVSASKETTLAGLGITDAPTVESMQEEIDQLRNELRELYLYVMAII